MPKVKRPLRGSRAFYPRKRAKRIYPRVKNIGKLNLNEIKPLAFAAYKAGMTHVILKENNPNSQLKGKHIMKAVTILDAPPISVFGFRCYTTDENNRKISAIDIFSEKLNKNLARKLKIKPETKLSEKLEKISKINIIDVTLLCHTNPSFKKKPEVFEIPINGEINKKLEYAKQILGKEINISDIFKEGEYVDVSAVTKGKGTEGPVKRFGIVVLGRKYQQMQRHVGSLGTTEPGKIRPTVPAAGQLGFQTRTEFNKRILKIQNGFEIKGGFVNYGNVKNNAIILEGSVPGPAKRLIFLKYPVRLHKTKYPIEIIHISNSSNLGD
ncbi:MAG: 50S ribosomal protein L3 [Candidatus Aenigmatarchaeota archaeon]